MWGAFGNPPDSDPPAGAAPAAGAGGGGGGRGRGAQAAPVLDTEGNGAEHFGNPVHAVKISNDNLVYVADRSNRRIQVFTPAGKYVTQVFINRAGPSAGSVAGLAFSPDPQQQFLYAADYGNSHIAVLDRKTLRGALSVWNAKREARRLPGPASHRRRFEGESLRGGSRSGQPRAEVSAQGDVAHASAECTDGGAAGAGAVRER